MPERDWLTVAEAAASLGVKPGVIQEQCNHVDKKTGLHSPKIEHIRIGSVGRPSKRHGLRGAIRISRAALDAYIEASTHREGVRPQKKERAAQYKCRYL